jgi:pimeloyl-ACP methyl ester carboxylesterase
MTHRQDVRSDADPAWVDVEYLSSLDSFADPARGFEERFLMPTLGGAPTIATITESLGTSRSIGWVICHSFGLEQVYLRTMEAAFARAMASAGFPSVRIHGRGYGDGAFVPEGVGLSSHIEDAVDAVELLVTETGVDEIGLAGPRFGASVAAIVAARRGASGLIMWDPVVSGKRFVDAMLQQTVLSSLAGKETAPARPLSVARKGPIDLQGVPLSEQASNEIAGMDLTAEVVRFAGQALIVQISRAGEASPDVRRLLTALREGNGTVAFEHVPPGAKQRPFGGPSFRGTLDGTKVDTQRELQGNLIERAVGWAERSWPVSSDTGEESE